MKGIGYKLVNVSLHYGSNQGLDLIFVKEGGPPVMVQTYAAVEAKSGIKLSSLTIDGEGNRQGSEKYNIDRLHRYLKRGDGSQKQLAKKLLDLAEDGQLESYASLSGENGLWRLKPAGFDFIAEPINK